MTSSMTVSAEEKARLKGLGILADKNGTFVARIVTGNGVLDAAKLNALRQVAEKYGNGKVALTVRMCVEIQGIAYENIEPLCEELAAVSLYPGGTGPKVRPIVACKGTVCPHGLIDTQGLAMELNETFYKGWHEIKLPAKFKIGVGGCPNNCVKPNLNDFGIIGGRFADGTPGYRICVGGYWGKKQRIATPLEGLYTREQVMAILEKTLTLWKEEGTPGQRFGVYLDSIGMESFLQKLQEA